ncbi:hypothetical protein [Bacteroides sp.]|uniref:hypothetical protein n=1 Tax=Bacteroides sp. TaxID=29523 RepID=UPI002628AA0C|nr:hypothetical protein [Bacteroides sp.]MDD3037938.1 hypothetical protein [Bacteroides sp.]
MSLLNDGRLPTAIRRDGNCLFSDSILFYFSPGPYSIPEAPFIGSFSRPKITKYTTYVYLCYKTRVLKNE